MELIAENGEIIADSAEGYRHKGYAINMADAQHSDLSCGPRKMDRQSLSVHRYL